MLKRRRVSTGYAKKNNENFYVYFSKCWSFSTLACRLWRLMLYNCISDLDHTKVKDVLNKISHRIEELKKEVVEEKQNDKGILC